MGKLQMKLGTLTLQATDTHKNYWLLHFNFKVYNFINEYRQLNT